MRKRYPFLLVAFFAVVTGCGGYVGRAKKDYDQGRYLEAAEKLGQHEPELGDLSERKKADYGIYRGMSLMMLGDHPGAYRWLSFAYEVERMNPGTLKPEQRAVLDRGFWQLNQVMKNELPPGTMLVPASPTVVAPSSAPPAPAPP